MALKRRNVFFLAWGAVALMVSAGVFVWRTGRAQPGPATVVHMSARDFRFNGGNPTLTFRRGERVEVIVSNDDAQPVQHGFIIPGLGAQTPRKLQPGESFTLAFTATKEGVYTYT